MRKECQTCLYWRERDEYNYGKCYRYPPTVVDSRTFKHPITMEDDACGEWKEKTK